MRTEDHRKAEAVLFTVGKKISAEQISDLIGKDLDSTKLILEDLKEEYDSNDTCLKVEYGDGLWKLTVEDDYLSLVSDITKRTELGKGVLETLSVIAWKEPVLQSEIVDLRHNKAYNHIRELDDKGFITKEKDGRSYRLELTQKFFDYFDIQDNPKDKLKKAADISQVEEMQKEIERKEKEIEEAQNEEGEDDSD